MIQSDPNECLYCLNNQTLSELMFFVADLNVSRLFLFKEQTYYGRCVVVYKDHVNDITDLSDIDRKSFMDDVAEATRAIKKVFNPDKVNFGAYSDKLTHLHFHLTPKYQGGPDWGGIFMMNPKKVCLTHEKYMGIIEELKSAIIKG